MGTPFRDALAAHDGEFLIPLPELSNSGGRPGKAGGSPPLTLDSWKHTQRSKLFAENYAIHDISREWLPTVPYTDTAEPLRIAFSSGPWQEQDQQFLYPFLGARLQHTLMYIPTSRDGRILPHDGTDARPGERSFEHWVARLSEHAITHVMSFGPPTVELGWMEDAPSQFRRLEGDGQNWGFYEFGS